ncbi:MAG: STAS domain-containing protein [Proteobacteria bacterium]|nr:STAS domain-containing protein [Pseudomonadota bacterium]
MAEGSLQIQEAKKGEVCIVTLAGRIDSTNAEQVMTRLCALLGAGEARVLVDLKQVVYLTSAAFRALLVAADEAERRAAQLILCSVKGQVRELFEMGGLLDAFAIQGTCDEAIRQLG